MSDAGIAPMQFSLFTMCSNQLDIVHHISASSGFSIVLSDSYSVWLRVRRNLQTSAPSHRQKIVHPIFMQLHATVRHPEGLQLQLMSCNMSGVADNVPDGTVREPGYLGGQAPSHTLLSQFLVVTQEVLPSILPL